MADDDLRFGDVADGDTTDEPLTEKIPKYIELLVQLFILLVFVVVLGRLALQMMGVSLPF